MITRQATSLLIAVLLCIAPGAAWAQAPADAPDGPVDAGTRAAVIDGALKQLNAAYVFPAVAAKMDAAIRERQKKGEYDQVTSARQFAELLTEHLRAISHDKHLGLFYSAEPLRRQGGAPSDEEREQLRKRASGMNYGFRQVQRLRGNIGYLALDSFAPPSLAGETAASAMTFLAHTDALIIDLRQNSGGSPEMVALLCTYLFGEEPVHLNDLYWRSDNSTRQYWTYNHVSGQRFGAEKPVYLLTSKRTFSAAEEFTYNLKNLKRAVVVGETTGGGAHPGGVEPLTEHVGIFIPRGRAINPITKTNWEGTGVTPDMPVAADQALHTAEIACTKRLLERTKDARDMEELKRLVAHLEAGGKVE